MTNKQPKAKHRHQHGDNESANSLPAADLEFMAVNVDNNVAVLVEHGGSNAA
jgi:hypothetical protein